MNKSIENALSVYFVRIADEAKQRDELHQRQAEDIYAIEMEERRKAYQPLVDKAMALFPDTFTSMPGVEFVADISGGFPPGNGYTRIDVRIEEKRFMRVSMRTAKDEVLDVEWIATNGCRYKDPAMALENCARKYLEWKAAKEADEAEEAKALAELEVEEAHDAFFTKMLDENERIERQSRDEVAQRIASMAYELADPVAKLKELFPSAFVALPGVEFVVMYADHQREATVEVRIIGQAYMSVNLEYDDKIRINSIAVGTVYNGVVAMTPDMMRYHESIRSAMVEVARMYKKVQAGPQKPDINQWPEDWTGIVHRLLRAHSQQDVLAGIGYVLLRMVENQESSF